MKKPYLKQIAPYLNPLGLGIAVIGAMYQAIFMLRYTVRVPLYDEWENMLQPGLDKHLTWQFLLRFTSEHCMIGTRLLTWINYRLSDGAPIVSTYANYCIFLAACYIFYRLVAQIKSPGAALMLPLLALPLPFDVHGWSFQTHFYLSLLFILASIYALTRHDWYSWLAGPLAALGVFCFGAGVIATPAIVALALVLAIWQPRHFVTRAATVVFCGIAVAGYAIARHRHFKAYPIDRLYISPLDPLFWEHFRILITTPFGCSPQQKAIGFFITGTIAVTIIFFTLKAWRERSMNHLALSAVAAAIVMILMATSYARAGFGSAQGEDSRYTSYSLFLVVIIWAMQVTLCRRSPVYLVTLATCLLLAIIPKINYQHYNNLYSQSLDMERCLEAYYFGKVETCQLFPWSPSRGVINTALR